MSNRLEGKVALVTGGASGMGAATSRLFAAQGASVLIADVLEDEGSAVASELCEQGLEAKFVRLDVTDEANWSAVCDFAQSHYQRIDVLVNNAGVSGSDPDLFSLERWDQQMDVNARSVFLGMRTVVPLMREQGQGSIINISSISGLVGQTVVHMGYNAAKGAVRLASKAAAVQLARYNIRVNSVHPGVMPAMRTSMMTGDPAVREKMLRAIPMRREGRVEEVANVNLFLASDESSYVTGVEIPVDGGYVAT